MWRFGWRPYVPVHVRRERAARRLQAMRKKGLAIEPLEVVGRQIATTFWGQAWCRHLEKFSDYSNRLPRGRTYVRNGSVCHLQIQQGVVSALVSGSTLYKVKIHIKRLPRKSWTNLTNRCAGEIGSLLELLQGRLSDSVMEIVTDRDHGLFPRPGEIALSCSCPDWAVMCKHVAAVLYGVGARLDKDPAALFLLRGVNHEELVAAGVGRMGKRAAGDLTGKGRRLASERISEVFGIDVETGDEPETARAPRSARSKKGATSRVGRKARAGAKTPTSRRGKASRERRSTRNPTGRAVAALRAKFGMTQAEFASLLGVGISTVAKWEMTRGVLQMRSRSLDAWRSIEGLTPVGARRRLHRRGV